MELTIENGRMNSKESFSHSASAVVSALYDQYGTDVLRLCFTFMRNRPDAEDAAQETFLKIWRKLDSFEGRNHCTIRAWIMMIARNTCRDMLKKNWRKYEERTITPEDLPIHGKASRQDIELFMDVMSLPEKYRSVILLVYWQGMSVRETAKAVCSSTSTVTRRLEKAKALLDT